MKKLTALLTVLMCVSTLFGCAGDGQTQQLELITADMLAQSVYDTLNAEWAAFDALTEQEKMLSSSTPGLCQAEFDVWGACEEFLGLSVLNPLEEVAWLERGTYVGMPVGYADAPCVKTDWYGTRDGHVEWISVCGGYRYSECRITLEAKLYTIPAEETSPDSGWGVGLERSDYLKAAENGTPVITKDSGERHTAAAATLARENVLYTIRVTGEPGMDVVVEQTLEKLLVCFES